VPIVEKLMNALTAKYGAIEGENVYYSMEASAKGPFAKGARYHDLHLAFAEKHGLEPIGGPAPRRTSPVPGRRKVARTRNGRGPRSAR
jgi:hypothetical protein